MDILAATKSLLKQYNLRLESDKSQNFLIVEDVYRQVIKAANLNNKDVVLEIGPGFGFLTTNLLENSGQVIAVEFDKRLLPILNKINDSYDNFKLINEDILKYNETELPTGYKLVANIPYHLTGKIIRKFMSSNNKPELAVLLMQKEVGERICAKNPNHTLLSLSVQYYGEPEIIQVVSRDSFYPAPQVDSVILAIKNIKKVDEEQEKKFWQLAKCGFASKRKTLVHNLAAGLKINKQILREKVLQHGFKDKIRAQELSIQDWEILIGLLLDK